MLNQKMLLQRCAKFAVSVSLNPIRNLSNKTCIFSKPRRSCFLRQFPTLMVRPDGSTFTARYDEPRGIIKLPLDINKLSEAERLEVLENRKPKKKILFEKEDAVEIDRNMYLKFLKKK